jgi:hypothetical protein
MSCQKIIGSAYYNQTHSCLHLLENKPQINADERRFVNLNIQHFSEVYKRNSLIKSPQSTQRSQSIAAIIFASFALWYEKKFNNELVRTPYELTLSEFVSVRFSSLFLSCSFIAAFLRVHPRLLFYRGIRERGEVAG